MDWLLVSPTTLPASLSTEMCVSTAGYGWSAGDSLLSVLLLRACESKSQLPRSSYYAAGSRRSVGKILCLAYDNNDDQQLEMH